MNPRRILATALVPVALAACSGGSPASDTASVDTTSTATAASGADSSASGGDAASGGTDTTVSDGAIEISVEVGVDSGPTRIEQVALGSLVRITVTNEDDEEEVHLHGYDLGGDLVEPGEPTVFEFEASTAGEFEVESHVTGEVLMILVVR